MLPLLGVGCRGLAAIYESILLYFFPFPSFFSRISFLPGYAPRGDNDRFLCIMRQPFLPGLPAARFPSNFRVVKPVIRWPFFRRKVSLPIIPTPARCGFVSLRARPLARRGRRGFITFDNSSRWCRLEIARAIVLMRRSIRHQVSLADVSPQCIQIATQASSIRLNIGCSTSESFSSHRRSLLRGLTQTDAGLLCKQ